MPSNGHGSFFTEVWNLDKNRLWVTVFEEDEESYLLWPKITNIDPNRVLKSGRKDNFWEMGETDPAVHVQKFTILLVMIFPSKIRTE